MIQPEAETQRAPMKTPQISSFTGRAKCTRYANIVSSMLWSLDMSCNHLRSRLEESSA